MQNAPNLTFRGPNPNCLVLKNNRVAGGCLKIKTFQHTSFWNKVVVEPTHISTSPHVRVKPTKMFETTRFAGNDGLILRHSPFPTPTASQLNPTRVLAFGTEIHQSLTLKPDIIALIVTPCSPPIRGNKSGKMDKQ